MKTAALKHPSFPPYAALINPAPRPATAFALRFVETIPFFQRTTIKPHRAADKVQVLEQSTGFISCDAGLMLSPYVRFRKMSRSLTERVRKAKLSMVIDGEEVFRDQALWTFERDRDGRISDAPWCDFHTTGAALFRGVVLRHEYSRASQNPDDAIGLFLPHDSRVHATVSDLPKDDGKYPTVHLEVGIILGRYTTKARPPSRDE